MTNGEYQQLVEFLGRQFTAIDRRFAALEERVEQGFRDVTGHFDAVYARFDRLEQEYFAIVEALRRIETTLTDERVRREALERGLAELRERVGLLQARIDELERRLH
jgi:chromosome segregation ATPase